jgi:hypothetical protein
MVSWLQIFTNIAHTTATIPQPSTCLISGSRSLPPAVAEYIEQEAKGRFKTSKVHTSPGGLPGETPVVFEQLGSASYKQHTTPMLQTVHL